MKNLYIRNANKCRHLQILVSAICSYASLLIYWLQNPMRGELSANSTDGTDIIAIRVAAWLSFEHCYYSVHEPKFQNSLDFDHEYYNACFCFYKCHNSCEVNCVFKREKMLLEVMLQAKNLVSSCLEARPL